MNDVSAKSVGPGALLLVLASIAAVALAVTMSAAGAGSACGVCGKNLVKNPGAELGMGVMAVGAYGKVPGWENVAGQFGAASYKFSNGWFSTLSKGSPKRGKNYFFGGLAIFPKVVHMALEMEAMGVRHVHCHFSSHPAAAGYLINRLTGIPYSFASGSSIQVQVASTNSVSGRSSRRISPKTSAASSVIEPRNSGVSFGYFVSSTCNSSRRSSPSHAAPKPSNSALDFGSASRRLACFSSVAGSRSFPASASADSSSSGVVDQNR